MKAQWFIQEEIIEWPKELSSSRQMSASEYGREQFLVRLDGVIEARLLRVSTLPWSHHLVLDKNLCTTRLSTVKDSFTRRGILPQQAQKSLNSSTALLLFVPTDISRIAHYWSLQDRKAHSVSRSYNGYPVSTVRVESYTGPAEKKMEWHVYFSSLPGFDTIPICKELVVDGKIYRRHYFLGRYEASPEEREFLLSLRRSSAEKVSWEKVLSAYTVVVSDQ